MNNNGLRTSSLLNGVTYIGAIAMSLLGIAGLSSYGLQLAVLGLCFLFALFYRIFFQSSLYQKNANLYFGLQFIVISIVFLINPERTDAFNFLFILLTLQTSIALPIKKAVAWIAIYDVYVSVFLWAIRGIDGLYAVVFYLIGYVVTGYLGYIIRQVEQERGRNQILVDELKETQQKLQELAVVEERNRLARDLHDSVKQQVFAISMQLGAARTALSETDKAHTHVTEAEHLAQQAGAELTTLINALRPPGLGSKPFVEAIREQLYVWSRQNDIKVETNINSSIRLNEKIEQALFRVLQEALANVARHSKADQVTINLVSEKDAFALSIEDNGIGFDAKKMVKGIGLDSMQERLIAVNGKVDIESARSKGTRVIAKVRMS